MAERIRPSVSLQLAQYLMQLRSSDNRSDIARVGLERFCQAVCTRLVTAAVIDEERSVAAQMHNELDGSTGRPVSPFQQLADRTAIHLRQLFAVDSGSGICLGLLAGILLSQAVATCVMDFRSLIVNFNPLLWLLATVPSGCALVLGLMLTVTSSWHRYQRPGHRKAAFILEVLILFSSLVMIYCAYQFVSEERNISGKELNAYYSTEATKSTKRLCDFQSDRKCSGYEMICDADEYERLIRLNNRTLFQESVVVHYRSYCPTRCLQPISARQANGICGSIVRSELRVFSLECLIVAILMMACCFFRELLNWHLKKRFRRESAVQIENHERRASASTDAHSDGPREPIAAA